MRNSFSSHPVVDSLPFVSKIEELLSDPLRQEARVAQYLLLNQLDLGFKTGSSIAKKTGTSEVTVSRLLHRLGYRGMLVHAVSESDPQATRERLVQWKSATRRLKVF